MIAVDTREAERTEKQLEKAKELLASLAEHFNGLAEDAKKKAVQWSMDSDYLEGFHTGSSKALYNVKRDLEFALMQIENI